MIAFLDDVAILGQDFESHLANLSQYGIKLKLRKCQLMRSSVLLLVSRSGVQANPANVSKIQG